MGDVDIAHVASHPRSDGSASGRDSAELTMKYLPCPCNSSTASIKSLSCPVRSEVDHVIRCHAEGTCSSDGVCNCYDRKFWHWPDCEKSVVTAFKSWKAVICSFMYLAFGLIFVMKYRHVSAVKRTFLQRGMLVVVAV